jgi:Glutaminase
MEDLVDDQVRINRTFAATRRCHQIRFVDDGRYKSNTIGKSSQVYPALARVPSDLFGVCVIGTNGDVYAVGAVEHEFSIMSVSKPFVFAAVCQAIGRSFLAGRRKLVVAAVLVTFGSALAITTSSAQSSANCRAYAEDYSLRYSAGSAWGDAFRMGGGAAPLVRWPPIGRAAFKRLRSSTTLTHAACVADGREGTGSPVVSAVRQIRGGA